uniref:Uncharacterized protein n=1 Tax=Arundo donax TaxID=35708 RepID=A0A0A9BPP6_ARUDO
MIMQEIQRSSSIELFARMQCMHIWDAHVTPWLQVDASLIVYIC